MDSTRFDRISKLFSMRKLSRRTALATGGMGIAGAMAGASRVAAQDAAPAASPIAEDADKVAFLFVQTFGAGQLAPTPGADTLTLTADHLAGQTVYFSDRPDRIVGMVATERFLGTGKNSAAATPAAGLGFTPLDPPNAALVFASDAGTDDPGDVVVLELINPTFDPSTGKATYEVRVLADDTAVDISLQKEPIQDVAVSRQFDEASLFIDDCPDGQVYCLNAAGQYVGEFDGVGFCYVAAHVCCTICDPNYWVNLCNDQFGEQCNNACTIEGLETWHC